MGICLPRPARSPRPCCVCHDWDDYMFYIHGPGKYHDRWICESCLKQKVRRSLGHPSVDIRADTA